MQPEDLKALLKSNPQKQHLLLINNPHKPTGAIYTKKELRLIKEVCEK